MSDLPKVKGVEGDVKKQVKEGKHGWNCIEAIEV